MMHDHPLCTLCVSVAKKRIPLNGNPDSSPCLRFRFALNFVRLDDNDMQAATGDGVRERLCDPLYPRQV